MAGSRRVLKAIRENEPRAVSLGYRTDHYKLAAFVLSAGLAGLAGATKAIVFQLASLTDVHWTMSGEVVLMTLVGGMGTIFGPVAGATKAIVFQLASLTDVHWSMSGEVVLMTLLGGMGTIFGPVVGAFAIIEMENYIAELGSWFTITQGAIFVVCVLAFRKGIIGELEAWLRRRRVGSRRCPG